MKTKNAIHEVGYRNTLVVILEILLISLGWWSEGNYNNTILF